MNKAVPIEKLMDAALEMAGKIAQNSLFSIRLIKENLDMARTRSPEEMLDFEVDACLQTVFAPEREGALRSFENRRR